MTPNDRKIWYFKNMQMGVSTVVSMKGNAYTTGTSHIVYMYYYDWLFHFNNKWGNIFLYIIIFIKFILLNMRDLHVLTRRCITLSVFLWNLNLNFTNKKILVIVPKTVNGVKPASRWPIIKESAIWSDEICFDYFPRIVSIPLPDRLTHLKVAIENYLRLSDVSQTCQTTADHLWLLFSPQHTFSRWHDFSSNFPPDPLISQAMGRWLKVSGPFVETSCVFQGIKNIINAEMWAWKNDSN